jgi:hypothetical protein
MGIYKWSSNARGHGEQNSTVDADVTKQTVCEQATMAFADQRTHREFDERA